VDSKTSLALYDQSKKEIVKKIKDLDQLKSYYLVYVNNDKDLDDEEDSEEEGELGNTTTRGSRRKKTFYGFGIDES
jgi:hypothetical protein